MSVHLLRYNPTRQSVGMLRMIRINDQPENAPMLYRKLIAPITKAKRGISIYTGHLLQAALTGLAAVAAVQGNWFTTDAAGQSSAQAQSLPVFEVDHTWPKLPPQWKLGEVSHINADSQGNVYLLYRPRTLKDPDFAHAAPPVLVFDPDGNFLRAWGGDGAGYEWPQREHGIYIDPKSYVWISGNSCPSRLVPGLPRGKPGTDPPLLNV